MLQATTFLKFLVSALHPACNASTSSAAMTSCTSQIPVELLRRETEHPICLCGQSKQKSSWLHSTWTTTTSPPSPQEGCTVISEGDAHFASQSQAIGRTYLFLFVTCCYHDFLRNMTGVMNFCSAMCNF